MIPVSPIYKKKLFESIRKEKIVHSTRVLHSYTIINLTDLCNDYSMVAIFLVFKSVHVHSLLLLQFEERCVNLMLNLVVI